MHGYKGIVLDCGYIWLYGDWSILDFMIGSMDV